MFVWIVACGVVAWFFPFYFACWPDATTSFVVHLFILLPLATGLRPIKLPPYQLKAGGSYLALQLALKPIMDYEDLKSQVFQNFRETGNALAFFHLMDATMTQSNCFEFVTTSSFFGVSPETLDMTTITKKQEEHLQETKEFKNIHLINENTHLVQFPVIPFRDLYCPTVGL